MLINERAGYKIEMITLPINMTATKYPGYFWDVIEQRLYSLKVTGVLRPIKLTQPNNFNKLHEPGYRVSVNGKPKMLMLSSLLTLTLVHSIVDKHE